MSAHFYKTAGILLALLAMSLFSLAPVLQKSALDRLPPLSFSIRLRRATARHDVWKSVLSLLKNRRWMIGFAVGCLGLLPYAAALRLVGVAVVQPLYGFGVIVLITVSRFILHEKLHPMAWLALVLLILMPVLIAFGDVSGVQYDITQRSTQISLGVFLLTVLLTGGVLMAFAKQHPIFWAVVSGALFGAGAVFAQMAISFLTLDELRSAESFRALIRNEDLLFSLAAVLFAIPLNVFADYCMQVGLQQKTAARFMPIAQTVNNVAAVAGGIAIFGQRVTHWPFYIAGIAMGIAGLFLLTAFKHRSEQKIKSGE
jgi:drug/metabolite transporter (DMT)-like permease